MRSGRFAMSTVCLASRYLSDSIGKSHRGPSLVLSIANGQECHLERDLRSHVSSSTQASGISPMELERRPFTYFIRCVR